MGVLRALGSIFQNNSKWLFLEIKTYIFLHQGSACTHVCTPIQTDMLKPAS